MAISATGDVGLAQINAKIHHLTVPALQDPTFNLQKGAMILAAFVHKFGLREGLHHYNGMGNPTDSYARSIFQRAGVRYDT